ncbi:MAG: arabinose ABC transporter permease, partial [Acidobacteria bacterium]|nr:arabinose ABC transporter permease [Acidobacteriota bacterium]
VTTYRIAFIVAGGGIAAIASWLGWSGAFAVCAGIMAALLLFSFSLPPGQRGALEKVNVISGLRRWINRPGAGWLLALVLLYRVGDAAVVPMSKPFWVDNGFSVAEIGMVTSALGMTFTIAGAWIGGLIIVKIGLWRSMLWLGIVQILSNAGYALLATFGGGRPGFYGAAIVESFTGGLGTAAFLAFLMAICDRRFAATEYALLSALFALTRTVAGATSGVITDSIGYAGFFWITLVLGIPALMLLPKIRGELEA